MSDEPVAKPGPGLWAELRRRNVIRMAGLYVVGAWLVLQVAETVLPILDSPPWVLKALLFLLILGLVPAMVFSWIYELTPDGLKRDADAGPREATSTETARRYDQLTLVALLAVVALVAADRLWPGAEPATGSEPAVQVEPAPGKPSPSFTANTGATAPAGEDGFGEDHDRRSIAVLPFVNMSSDPENEHFADGMSEELLNILAGIDGLKVASRTSAFSFKGKDTPIPDIARQLDVAHVLEGSVRKQGNRVRITAQLIEAGSDAHLWTQTYQRDLDDIFLVQEEIATAITTALQEILGAQQVKVEAPTRDMQAYQHYLRGRSRFYQRVELDQAIDDLSDAVQGDPLFAEAWAFLGAASHVIGSGGYPTEKDRAETLRLSQHASERARALKPDIPISLAVQGQLIADSKQPGRIAESIRLLELAAATPSPDTTPRLWLALSWLELGYVERAFPLLESAQSADPMVGINNGYLGLAHAIEGRMAQARERVLQAVRLNGLTFWAFLLVTDHVHADKPSAAMELLNDMLALQGEGAEALRNQTLAVIEAIQNPATRAVQLQSRPQRRQDSGLIAVISILFDNADVAFKLHGQEILTDWHLVMSAWLPAMQWLREDPRYFRLMESKGHVEYWDSHGYPRGCKPVDGADGRHLSCPEQP